MTIHPARPPHVALADHFAAAASSQHPLRVRLRSGEEFDCYAPVFDADQLLLVVTTAEGVTRHVRPDEIEALYEHRLRWPVLAGFISATVALGAGTCALVIPLLSPLTAVYGAVIGALGGAVAAALVPSLLPTVIPFEYARLLDRLSTLAYWQPVYPKPTPNMRLKLPGAHE